MTAPQTTATSDPQSIIAALQQKLDAALSEKAALAEELGTQTTELAKRTAELATRNTEYGERIEHQSATIDVLKAMSASPGDAQPVFDLIAERARDICGGYGVSVHEFDGSVLHLRAYTGVSEDPRVREVYEARYPTSLTREVPVARAIMERRVIRFDDFDVDPGLSVVRSTVRSAVAVPMMRGNAPIGGLIMGSRERGGFSDSQIELLKTFAEQAVIAITSAETYRALQTRTSDLHTSLEYQTASSDVLKVISRSTFDLQPVLDTVVATAARLCDADQAAIFNFEDGMVRLTANIGYPPEYQANFDARGLTRLAPDSPSVLPRAVRERRAVQVHDAAAVPGYSEAAVQLGNVRTALGVPFLRKDEPIGVIVLSRQRVEPFTDRQIELVSTFADQAVIAIENTRLITDQREALEQQTATAEVLQVINASPGNLTPVFDAMLEKAMRLCEAAIGILFIADGDVVRVAQSRNVPPDFRDYLEREPPRLDAGSLLSRAMREQTVLNVTDLRETAPFRDRVSLSVAAVELGGIRSICWAPLVHQTRALGLFAIFRQEVRAFSDKQIALLENFAAQAVIAMENARLLTEQKEALEQQTATAEVLQVINSSPGNLAPVFDAMLEKAMRLCEAAIGVLWTYDGERLHAVALRGARPAFAEFLTRTPHSVGPDNAHGRLLHGEPVVHIADVMEDEAYRSGDPIRRTLVELGGGRTLLAVPLRKDDVFLGDFAIYRQEVRPFAEKQIALLENFAAQAVIAMENARLINEQREALEQQTATAEVLQVINASPGNLAPVFDAMLEKAMRLSGAAYGVLRSYDGEHMHMLASRGVPTEYAEFLARSGGTGTPGDSPMPGTAPMRALETRQPTQRLDVRESIGYTSGIPGTRAIADLGGARTCLHVPLVKDQVSVGLLTFYRQEVRAFSDKQIALLQNFAAQAVIAMENARLLTEQREALEQQTATAEVLQVINASPGNLAPVFDAILEKAHKLCEVGCGSLHLFEGETGRAVAVRGLSDAHANRLRQGYGVSEHLVTRQLLAGKRFVQFANAADVDISLIRTGAEIEGIRTVMFMPLRKDEVLLGMIVSSRREVRLFSDKEIELLQNFATQAVIAMESARLLNELRTRTDELAQRQAELRITFENMGDGVAMFDETQHLVAWNRKFQDILDAPDEALAARPTFVEYIRYLTERGEFGQGAEQEEQVRRIQATRGRATVFERTRPNGRVIEVRHNPVPGGGFVLIYADITERKRSEAEIRAARDAAEEASRTIEAAYRELKTAQANLIQAEKMASLGQLTAGIAHEIKNPLNFVNNFAALSVDLLSELKETAAPGFAALTHDQRAEIDDVSAMLTSNLEKITEHGKRADGIVKAMLEHSRGSSGERRMVDLNALIDEALNLAYHGARAQDQSFNITLERDFGEGIAAIEVNPQDITRVFLNIFSNGFYAATRRARNGGDTGFAPTLKVTTRDAGEAVEIRVRDNGAGIPADIRHKLFQPFFTTKPTGEGTGLGLSITYDIVTQQHGGNIAVDSKVGDYSEFTIRLPRNL